MLRRSRGCDGMELRQIGQGKVSLGGQSLGTHMLLWVLPCALTGSNNATGIALPAPLYSVSLHGAATWSPVSGTASRIVIRERGGVWGLSPKCMECDGRGTVVWRHGRGENLRGMGCWKAVFLNETSHQGSGTLLSQLQT